MPNPGPARYAECCPHCGTPLTHPGIALGCGPGGSVAIRLPGYCPSAECRAARDDAAIAAAIARGVIDP